MSNKVTLVIFCPIEKFFYRLRLDVVISVNILECNQKYNFSMQLQQKVKSHLATCHADTKGEEVQLLLILDLGTRWV
jgi:hypothetical protein